jgi:gliding motility-associated-like protein
MKNEHKVLVVFLLFFQLVVGQTAPIAQIDNYATQTNIALNIDAPGILENDTDTDNDTLKVTLFSVNNIVFKAGKTANFREGSIVINSNGSFNFIPTTNYNGKIPEIEYTISDGTYKVSSKLNLTIINLFSPTPRDDYRTAEINTTLKIDAPGVLINDTDRDNNSLSIVGFNVNGERYAVSQTASFNEGSITINADGSFTFIPTLDYIGNVSGINYIISDGSFTKNADLFLTTEKIENLLEIESLESCNQGFTANKEYKISYVMTLKNTSTARDYHPNSLIRDIDITNNLKEVFGNSCVIKVDQVVVSTMAVRDFVGNPYPLEFDNSIVNPKFSEGTSTSILDTSTINNLVLYPRQSVKIQYCVTIDPFCNGRPNPTPSGANINFNNIVVATSDRGNSTLGFLLEDFHTTEGIVTAGLHIPNPEPIANTDGSFEFTNNVIITNEGTGLANNINYNMGLGDFLDKGLVLKELKITQVSGPKMLINTDYNGDTNTLILQPNNILESGETVVLEIFSHTKPFLSSGDNVFFQNKRSQTQGELDGFDETTAQNKNEFSFVIWSDNLGDHLDRYYSSSSDTMPVSSASQCVCKRSAMSFSYKASSENNIKIINVNNAPEGVLEHQEVTFQITATNKSLAVELKNIQIQDDLKAICSGKIITVSKPIIKKSTAIINPILDPSFNGVSNINIFDGSSGKLKINESITVEFTVKFNKSCIGANSSTFFAKTPLDSPIISSSSVNVNVFEDTDNDGINNSIDIDDDNDTILDISEYEGLDPLDADHDNDFIPNYRDLDFGLDTNNDGIIDVFDFDNDGVPNHLDLDSDNDGILDIVEVGNLSLDTSSNGRTNGNVGLNGLDNSIESSDTLVTTVTYIAANTDATGGRDFLDIDADGDGIVDHVEAQFSDNYVLVSGTVTETGIDLAHLNGILPIDTDNDAIYDYIDINSDNDNRDDKIEGWDTNSDGIAEIIATNTDLDADGLDDAYDINNNLFDAINNQHPTNFPNVDNADTPERDWREIRAIVVLIDDISVSEGEEMAFTISLVTKNDNTVPIESTFPISISFTAVNGTETAGPYEVAVAPFDYNSTKNVLFILPSFTASSEFKINSLEDSISEITEKLTLNGTITSNNTINEKLQAIGTIIDTNKAPSITMNNSREEEGVDLKHVLTLSHPSSRPVVIDVTTNDYQAISPVDYTKKSESLTIEGTIDPNNANITAMFSITTLTDNLNESDEETLNVTGNVTTGDVGVQDLIKIATILDIDPFPSIVIDNVSALEGNPLLFTIRLLNTNLEPMQNDVPIRFDLETVNDEAYSGRDFRHSATTITFPAYEFTMNKSVETINDAINEKTETMHLQVFVDASSPISKTSQIVGIGKIMDDDFPNLFSPNSDGRSDEFELLGIEESLNFKLVIYDRLGGEVYRYSNNGRINPIWWDGERNGEPVPEGVYYYTLNFNDGFLQTRTSFVQLIR